MHLHFGRCCCCCCSVVVIGLLNLFVCDDHGDVALQQPQEGFDEYKIEKAMQVQRKYIWMTYEILSTRDPIQIYGQDRCTLSVKYCKH
jgi:hypothetical protein